MEWALLVSYLYPIFTLRVCLCLRVRSGYLKFDQTRRWKMVAAWRVAAAEDKRKSESLCSLLFLPVIVFFFLPPPMFQTSLIPTPILFCASFEPILAKFDPHLIEFVNENQNPSLDLNFSEHECLVALPWFGSCCCCCCCFLWGPSVLLFRKGTIFQLTFIYIYISVVWEWAKIWRRVAQSMKTKQRRSSRAGGS
jgi:hypothetical protein